MIDLKKGYLNNIYIGIIVITYLLIISTIYVLKSMLIPAILGFVLVVGMFRLLNNLRKAEVERLEKGGN